MVQPDRYDVLGVAIAMIGNAIIVWESRLLCRNSKFENRHHPPEDLRSKNTELIGGWVPLSTT